MPDLRYIAEETGCRTEAVKAEKLSSYKGGGQIGCLFVPKDAEEFLKVLNAFKDESLTPYVLGGGSNTLIADGEVKTPVISTRGLNAVTIISEDENGAIVRTEAGVGLNRLLAICKGNGLCGLEFLSGIPATAGGAVRMNAGAFGHETADYLNKVTALNLETGEIYEKTPSGYAYRSGERDIVLAAEFLLKRCGREEFEFNASRCIAERRLRQPSKPSLGSVFKNPSGNYAARLIECAGMKGRRIGGAEISFKHANFIVNAGSGTAGDYLRLAEEAYKKVFETFGIELEREFFLLE